MVIVDTCIWSEALRRIQPNPDIANKLTELIKNNEVVVIGAIRQELLSGISDEKKFQTLKTNFSSFKDEEIHTIDYELAAEYSNLCRKNGIQGSNTDFLICALAIRHNWKIFTSDEDFKNYQKVLQIDLFI